MCAGKAAGPGLCRVDFMCVFPGNANTQSQPRWPGAVDGVLQPDVLPGPALLPPPQEPGSALSLVGSSDSSAHSDFSRRPVDGHSVLPMTGLFFWGFFFTPKLWRILLVPRKNCQPLW